MTTNLPEDPAPLPDQPIIPDENLIPGEQVVLPPARTRRARRALAFPGDGERTRVLERLGRRAFPAFEFFLFSLLCGAILGAGYLLDSQSLLLLGILLAPLMTPMVGLILSIVTGSWRFFFLTLAGLLLGGILIFLGGALAGLVARTGPGFSMVQAGNQSHLWWPNLCVLALGSVLLVASFVRSEEKPLLASVMVAYELFLPLSAAGYGLGRGADPVWPNGLLVFLFHFSLAILLGMITLFVMHFRPRKVFGYILPVAAGIVGIALVFLLSGLGNVLNGFFGPRPVALPTLTPSSAPSPLATSTITLTPVPTIYITPTLQIPATPTPTQTLTPHPTPVYARIHSQEGDGALVRSEPGSGMGYVVEGGALINDYLVEILPETALVNGVTWVRIRTTTGVEGWVLQSVLALATPVPNFTPTPTRTP